MHVSASAYFKGLLEYMTAQVQIKKRICLVRTAPGELIKSGSSLGMKHPILTVELLPHNIYLPGKHNGPNTYVCCWYRIEGQVGICTFDTWRQASRRQHSRLRQRSATSAVPFLSSAGCSGLPLPLQKAELQIVPRHALQTICGPVTYRAHERAVPFACIMSLKSYTEPVSRAERHGHLCI